MSVKIAIMVSIKLKVYALHVDNNFVKHGIRLSHVFVLLVKVLQIMFTIVPMDYVKLNALKIVNLTNVVEVIPASIVNKASENTGMGV